jgi:hypothetical protein
VNDGKIPIEKEFHGCSDIEILTFKKQILILELCRKVVKPVTIFEKKFKDWSNTISQ